MAQDGWPMKQWPLASTTVLRADVERVNVPNFTQDAAELARFGKRDQLKVSCFTRLFVFLKLIYD
jgi:hypothetical protein